MAAHGVWRTGQQHYDALNDEMARTCNVAVVSVGYRLAPEFPFPACIEDCEAAAKWLLNNAKKEFGTDKIFISGENQQVHTWWQLPQFISAIRCMKLIR